MNTLSKLFSTLLLFFLSYQLNAQSCNYFHKRNCTSTSEIEMKEDMQSKSALFSKGQQSDFNLIAYEGQDYRVVLCSDETFNEPLEFRIYEKVRQRIEPTAKAAEEPKETKSVASETEDDGWGSDNDDSGWGTADSYDSYSDDSWGSEGSSNTESSGKPAPKYKLVKELLYDNTNDQMAQELEFTADNTKSLIIEVKVPGVEVVQKLKIKEVGCVGVLVEHKKSGGLGF